MGCCKNMKSSQQEHKQTCPLCNTFGNSIHYLAVEMAVKNELISEVTKDQYYVCTDNSCEVVFYNQYEDRIFLVQDINMRANFDEMTKSTEHKCSSKCGECNNK